MMMMTSWRNIFLFTTIASLLALQFPPSLGSFGVNYGRKGDNLPPPPEVISLYKSGSHSATKSSPATKPRIYVPRAMTNIQTALTTIDLIATKVTTAISMATVTNTYPLSNGAFADQAANVMRDVVGFLAQNGSPLLLNTYPYQAYASEPDHISLAYATFQAQELVVINGDLKYFNLFDAMVDSVYAALEKVGGSGVPILVSETGWPTQGNDPYTSKENAQVYNQKLLAHVGSGEGTPRRPGQAVDAFIFTMFNEDQKAGTVEQNWGIFNPDMSSVYSLLNC
ncbi:glucan endo-1,3-beta-glucosidase-like [Senna tora]|uniref:glucan endo-1,3-beta-D-glucosidase n=1 Tax=Senna tora TaxID=362788 RepID=A0A834WA32_9FABA|nr:glucan endo-1,3-beta-glucosidase-like [Senna tora]